MDNDKDLLQLFLFFFDKSETISNYFKRFLINQDAKLIYLNTNQKKYGQIKAVNFTIDQ